MPIQINLKETPAQLFKRLQEDDNNLNNQNISNTMSFDFKTSTAVKNLLEPGHINAGGIEWDFDWNSGVRSLTRRGFYKITGKPFLRGIKDLETGKEVPTWSSDVFYCPDNNHHHRYFKFLANVGPMVNLEAIGYDLRGTNLQMITSKTVNDKGAFFISLINKVFYVSQQQYANGKTKQTVWFLFR